MEEEIINELNSKLDPYELIRLIAYRTDTVVMTEDKISIFCPIDKVDNMGYCEIDRMNLKFRCRHCFKKGNLVDFYRLAKGISMEKAVNELKKAFDIALNSEMKNKQSEGFKGTHYEKYEKLKSDLKEITSLKKEQISQNSEWLQNTLGAKADNYSNTTHSNITHSAPVQVPQTPDRDNVATVLPEVEKFIFSICTNDDFFRNMSECDYRRFQAEKLERLSEKNYVGHFLFKTSSVKLFGNMLKNRIVWMWGAPFIIFQKYNALTYYAPFYSARYSPFEKILCKGEPITLETYLSSVKKTNFEDFRFIRMNQEYKVDVDVVTSQEAFKDTVRFIKTLTDRHKIEMKHIRVLTDTEQYIVLINPYLFNQEPSRVLNNIYESLALELTSTAVTEDRIIEHTEYASCNFNVYHPGYVSKNINCSESSEYMWILPAEKLIDLTFDELSEKVHGKCNIHLPDFPVTPSLRNLGDMYRKIISELDLVMDDRDVSVDRSEPDDENDQMAEVSEDYEGTAVSAPQASTAAEVSNSRTPNGGKGNFLQFFSNEKYFVDKGKIESKGLNFFKKKIPSGNPFLDKMLDGGFLNFFAYFIASHNYVTEYTFLSKIIDSFCKQSPANFVVTDCNSGFASGSSADNLKIVRDDIAESNEFISELEKLKYSSLFFLHSLDFALTHTEFLKGICQPVLIYSNTSRYEEFEDISFRMKKGIKYIEVISVESRNLKSVVLYGANDKINIEKFDIPLNFTV